MSNSAPADTTRIAVADDSAVIRNLLEEILDYVEGYELVASFDNGRDIVAWVREGGMAEVFVIDMRLPGLSGTATISALRRFTETARILAFSASAQEESVRSATGAGANGYLLKESTLAELLDAISGGGGMNASEGATSSAPAKISDGNSDPGRGLTILVVDDHELLRDAAAAMLESKGFVVATCDSAEGAREWLEGSNHCDAALVDLRLGDASGATIVEVFRDKVPTSAVILHSGAADEDGVRVARETGADGFLAKGDYTIDEMVDTLTAAVELRRAAP
ncbi:MAG: response regulator [Solirubrobacterales bacterium]|nr:response regulator [Solirubrobacterales bacterium]